ncbi:zinc ribbon domain-containing protein [bacterium]|nr:zinc ribbon domain-containing protein [bacterium]
MGNKFTEVERTYRALSQSYDEGALDAEQFAQALAALEIQDEQEQWWQIQANGKWLRYNGEEWEEATPPRPGPPPPPRAALIPPPRRARLAPTPPPESSAPPPEDEDDSIFFQTGVPADQIPDLHDPEPAPGAFLLEENEPAGQVPEPLPVKVRAQPLLSAPSRPPATAVTATAPQAAARATRSVAPAAPTQAVAGQVAAPAHSDSSVASPPAVDHSSTCPKCHKQVPPGAHFCKYCGARPGDTVSPAPQLTASQNCPSCHQPVLPNARFCGKCGHALAAPSESAPSAPAACPKCHVPAVPGARFCKNCGHKLT